MAEPLARKVLRAIWLNGRPARFSKNTPSEVSVATMFLRARPSRLPATIRMTISWWPEYWPSTTAAAEMSSEDALGRELLRSIRMAWVIAADLIRRWQ